MKNENVNLFFHGNLVRLEYPFLTGLRFEVLGVKDCFKALFEPHFSYNSL